MRHWIRLIESLLHEAPIDITYQNALGGGSHYPDDAKLAQSEKAKLKASRVWRNSVADFNLLVLDHTGSPQDAFTKAFDGQGRAPMTLDKAEEILGAHYSFKVENIFRPDCINLILTNNEGTNRLPLTGWMIAHRFYHAFEYAGHKMMDERRDLGYRRFNYLYSEVLSAIQWSYRVWKGRSSEMPGYMDVAPLLCPTRAGRMHNLTNEYEVIPELFARYTLTGKTNLPELSNEFVGVDGKTYRCVSDSEYDQVLEKIDELQWLIDQYFPWVIEKSVGKIFWN